MKNYTHATAPTLFVEAKGIKYAYRRFGNPDGLPLVFLQHLTGTLENWDPAVIDPLSEDREVILFDNAGVASSTGEVATTVKGIAKTALDFIDAIGVKKIDLLGFSMGGFVAQQVTLERPDLVRRLILVGSAAKGGHETQDFTPDVWNMFQTAKSSEELLLQTFFLPNVNGQAAGSKFLKRLEARTKDRDIAINEKVVPNQIAAIAEWGVKTENSFDYLKKLTLPVLLVHGSHDIIFPTYNSYILYQNLPNAYLIMYPDSNHGAMYQYPDLFVTEAAHFLDGEIKPVI